MLTAEQIRSAAKAALELLAPAIENCVRDWSAEGMFVTVGIRNGGKYLQYASHEVGDPAKWTYPYATIAVDKAEISGRTGKSSRKVQLTQSLRLMEGDTKYWGSVILDDYVIVGASGGECWEDEAVAYMVAFLFKGLLERLIENARKTEGDNF